MPILYRHLRQKVLSTLLPANCRIRYCKFVRDMPLTTFTLLKTGFQHWDMSRVVEILDANLSIGV
ncbi:hypothetical protein MPTK1_2g01340 [Marchantia polymorpha subsp. ruderalis]